MKKFVFSGALAVIVFTIIELTAFAAIRILYQRHYLSPPHPKDGVVDYARHHRLQDELLGTPLKDGRDTLGGRYRDLSGARRLPAFPDPERSPTCVSLYGDSFTEAFGMDDEHEWANVLALQLNCRIANYAQAGYGTDQAVLRHRVNPGDKAPVTILGHMHEDVRRNLTRIRDLVTGGRDLDLKPRFFLDAKGELSFVPLPELTENQYDRAVGLVSPMLQLEHENFQPGGPLVAPIPRFPYIQSLIESLHDYRIRARYQGNRPNYAEFYEPGNLTQGLPLLVALAKAFQVEAAARGQRAILLFLPPREVLAYHFKTGKWVHQPLLDRLEQEKVAYMDFGPHLIARGESQLKTTFASDGHYSSDTQVVLAKMVANELVKRGLVADPRDPTRSGVSNSGNAP